MSMPTDGQRYMEMPRALDNPHVLGVVRSGMRRQFEMDTNTGSWRQRNARLHS